MTKPGKDYPLQLCSTCAGEYAAGGFRVVCETPRQLLPARKCDGCGRYLPVFRCRLDGRGAARKRKTGGR